MESSAEEPPPPLPPPLFTFGAIADIQYADIDDGFNYTGTRQRYYRGSLQLLRRAADSWRSAATGGGPASLLRFVLQLGDIVDGFNSRQRGASERALDAVLGELDRVGVPVHHVWGNHEFYNFSRDELMRVPAEQRASGSGRWRWRRRRRRTRTAAHRRHLRLPFQPCPRVQYNNALNILKEHNSNEDLNHPPVEKGMSKFAKFNGGFSRDQLSWLDGVLSQSDDDEERVIIVSHLPVHPLSADPVCLAWNSEDVLAMIGAHGCVVCFMAGHDHDGGYHRDRDSGVHHLTLEGVIETPPESDAFATVSVYEDRMLLKGRGRTADREMLFTWPPDETQVV
ncbi:Manganese-dependent ADP-ribose/CDP-alcohol diphosphatase [Merluccius polli]|uniref:Manganese-dependent ADP-ribose/CDP-alcohol diphosphatase n=1 Tax=Merluccius polli TaxID=89951 RepID=A0AA47M0V6_MERPO|nr:Manganese-dependent ADP-ribose/CDP-alcohol diphosphatase [Merluccius polli]